MTLKSRNKIFLALFIISTLFFVLITLAFSYAGIKHQITPPDYTYRLFNYFPNVSIFKYNFIATVAGIYIFTLIVPILSLYIYKEFEKTPSSEILFFSLFLLGCLGESVRLTLPLFNFWKTFSSALIITGRIIIASRFLTSLSIFFAFSFNTSLQKQYEERNCLILLIVAISLATFFPMDNFVTSTCTIQWGFSKTFRIIRTLIFLATLSILIVDYFSKKNTENIKLIFSYTITYLGYTLLCCADSIFILSLSLILFIPGIFFFLRSVHKINTW